MKSAMRLTAARNVDNRARRRYRAYLAAAMIAVAAPVSAQPVCNMSELIRDRLAAGYGKERAAQGLAVEGALVELWANHDTGSWSLLVTTPDGISCLVASGGSFRTFAARPNL